LSRDAAGQPQLPDQQALAPDAALDLAQQLIDSGRPFSAHEVLEASWKAAPPAERALWRGLAQVAVGLTHAQRGNASGAATLLRRGAQGVADYATVPPHGIDAAHIARRATELAGLIERDGLATVAPGAMTAEAQAPGAVTPGAQTPGAQAPGAQAPGALRLRLR
jgi:hypothetical protein